jgi:two-component system CheB/CheR fusion protein
VTQIKNEQLKSTNEQLKSTNEQLKSTNGQLKSTNEQLKKDLDAETRMTESVLNLAKNI